MNNTLITNTNQLAQLKTRYKKYFNNNSYVYKSCRDVLSKDLSRKWLVIMKKLKDTQTNETRSEVINENYAEYRANKLKVVKIINTRNPRLTKKFIVNKFTSIRELKYEENKIVHPDAFDNNLNEVCSNGIYYFKLMDAAYYYSDIPRNYTGEWYKWYDDGSKEEYCVYVNGNKQINESFDYLHISELGTKI